MTTPHALESTIPKILDTTPGFSGSIFLNMAFTIAPSPRLMSEKTINSSKNAIGATALTTMSGRYSVIVGEASSTSLTIAAFSPTSESLLSITKLVSVGAVELTIIVTTSAAPTADSTKNISLTADLNNPLLSPTSTPINTNNPAKAR